MDITVGVIVYALSLDTTIRTNIDLDNDLPIEAYEMWAQGIPRSNVLYIIDKDRLLQTRAIWRKKFVICNGWLKDDAFKDQELYWISVLESITLYELAGLVQRVFYQYFQWYIRLETLIRKKESLSSMLETLRETYRIISCIATESMEIIGICSDFEGSNTWVDQGKRTTLPMVNDLVADVDFRDSAVYDDVFLYQNIDQEWYYCYNFKIDGQYRARLVANAKSHQKTHGVQKLIHDLGMCIADVYEEHYSQEPFFQDGKEWRELLYSLVQGREVDRNDLQRFSKRCHWELDHAYQVILFQFQDGACGGIGMDYYRAQIRDLFQDCHVVRESDRFICIRNLTRCEDRDKAYGQVLPYFLRETLCKAGISNVFYDLSCLHRYCLEAEQALLTGGRIDGTQWYYTFSRYVVSYMMEQCIREFTAEDVCHPAIAVLRDYDAEHETHLLESLEVFLRERHSITYTAKLLDIHRTTLLVRLDRIRQLTGIDLDDYETCLHLMISFEIRKISL